MSWQRAGMGGPLGPSPTWATPQRPPTVATPPEPPRCPLHGARQPWAGRRAQASNPEGLLLPASPSRPPEQDTCSHGCSDRAVGVQYGCAGPELHTSLTDPCRSRSVNTQRGRLKVTPKWTRSGLACAAWTHGDARTGKSAGRRQRGHASRLGSVLGSHSKPSPSCSPLPVACLQDASGLKNW